MSTVSYLLVHDSAVPEDDAWLGSHEQEVLAGLRFPKRRHDWRLGRWTVKRALVALGELSEDNLTGVEIRAAADGAPELFDAGGQLDLPISISHRDRWGLAAVGSSGMRLGCDLEAIEPKSEGFLSTYFTEEELRQTRGSGPSGDRIAMAIWAGKEAALKAARTGLRRDTRSMEVSVGTNDMDGWASLAVRDVLAETTVHGVWREHEEYVLALIADPPVARWADLAG